MVEYLKKGYYKYNFSLNQIILEITIDKVILFNNYLYILNLLI